MKTPLISVLCFTEANLTDWDLFCFYHQPDPAHQDTQSICSCWHQCTVDTLFLSTFTVS